MRSLLATSAIAAFVPCVAFAQSSAPAVGAPSNVAAVQEVVVTARKVNENVQDVPVAVTALSGNDLKKASVKSIGDIQTVVPGLQLQQAVDDPQTLLFMLRGREQNDVALPIDPSIGFYVDGHYVPRTFGVTGDLLDINRVEVLRGPQGTLYGKNSTGGTVSVYTNDPVDHFFGSADVTVGNYGAYDFVGILNTPINDYLAGRFVIERGVSDGYGHDAVGDKLMSQDSQACRGKLRAKWSDNWSAVLSGDYQVYRSGGPIINLTGLSPASGAPQGGLLTLETEAETGMSEAQSLAYLNSLIAKGKANFYDDTETGSSPSVVKRGDLGLTIKGSLADNLDFVSITGFQHLDRSSNSSSPVPIQILAVTPRVRDNYFSHEFQILGKNGPIKWVAGLYVDYEHGNDFNLTTVAPVFLGAPTSAISSNTLTNSTVAPFGQVTWEFLAEWRLTAGVRYSSDTRQMDATDTSLGGAPPTCLIPAPGVESTALQGAATQCPRTFKNTYGEPSWLVSIDHNLSKGVLLYAKVATGYRSGGENEGGAVEIESFTPFKPETNLEYEVGAKTEFFKRRVRLNVAAYRDSYSNLQVTTGQLAADGSFVTLVSNAATAITQGVEVENDIVLARGLKLHSSAAYTDAHYIHFIDPQLGDRSHEKFAVPKWTAGTSLQYDRPLSFGSALVEVDYDFRSSVDLAPTWSNPSDVTQGSVALVNARLNVHVDALKLDIALFGKNLSDVKYYANANAFGLGMSIGYAAPPRTYGVELIKTF